MEENHATISKELDKIRFSKSIMINTTPNPVPEQSDLAIKDKTEDAVMNDDVKIEVIDLSDLPQELFTQIEDFIKKEIPEASEFTDAEVNDDIVEVPVPPKPIPEVVTLEEPDEQMQLEPDSNANSAKLNKARTAFQMSLNKDSELNINSNTIPEIITDSEQVVCDSNQVNKEIVEVPVPPKPKPQVVKLIEPNEQVQLEPDSNKDSNSDKGLNKQEENVNENDTISDSEEPNSDSNSSPGDSQQSLQNGAKLDQLKVS